MRLNDLNNLIINGNISLGYHERCLDYLVCFVKVSNSQELKFYLCSED